MSFIQNHIPLYLKLYWKLKDEILLMERIAGERMPTVEELHDQHSVSQSTVHKALDLLEKDGLITKQRARGIYVRDDIKVQQWDPVFTPESFKTQMQMFNVKLICEGWIKATQSHRNIFSGQQDVFKKDKIYRWQALATHKEEVRRKIFISVFLPAWLMTSLKTTNITQYVLNGLIEFNHHRTERIVAITRPWICNAEIASRFDILEGTPVFRRMQLYYSREDTLLACCDYIPTTHETYRETLIDWDKANPT